MRGLKGGDLSLSPSGDVLALPRILLIGEELMDRTTKFLLAVIAAGLWANIGAVFLKPQPAFAQRGVIDVRVVGGQLDYETDVSGGPTLKVCTEC